VLPFHLVDPVNCSCRIHNYIILSVIEKDSDLSEELNHIFCKAHCDICGKCVVHVITAVYILSIWIACIGGCVLTEPLGIRIRNRTAIIAVVIDINLAIDLIHVIITRNNIEYTASVRIVSIYLVNHCLGLL